MTQEIILHGYQQYLKSGIYHDWDAGNKNVLGVLPTGGGKSVIVSDIVLDGAKIGMTQAVIAHRNELVSQMSMHIANRGIPHRIVGPNSTIAQITRQHRKIHGQSFVNPSARTAVVGVDTLMARRDDLKDWAAQIERWIIDEGHHVTKKNKWGYATEMFYRAQGLGVTATPVRADGQGLGRHHDGVFDSMVLGPSMRELITLGNLSDYEIVCPTSDLELHEEDIGASGDYTPKKLRAAAEKSRIVGDVVASYCRFAFGKKAICFATDVATAGKIAANFNAVGIRAASLSAETPTDIREKFTNEFKNGKLTVLVNVDLFGEGFDVPACEVVIMARPTASLGLYLQMIGRGLRVFMGKYYGLIIDHVSNVTRHGLPDKQRLWTLDRRDKRGKQEKDPEDIPLITCKSCTRPYERFRPACKWCGFVPPLPPPRERTIDMVDGDLMLLDRAKLEQMRQNMQLEAPADIAMRIGEKHGAIAGKGLMNRQIEKIGAQRELSDTIGVWAALERAKGRDDSESYKRFYITTGLDVLSALSVERSRQDYEQLTQTVKGWYLK